MTLVAPTAAVLARVGKEITAGRVNHLTLVLAEVVVLAVLATLPEAVAVALEVAALRPERIGAVVCRGGRPDLAFEALGLVRCPTLLIVGAADVDVLELNAWAAAHLRARHDLLVVPGAGHLFSEPGALEAVAEASCRWFATQLCCS